MPISAGDIRATMTLDSSGFSRGVASAQSELATIEASGNKVTSAFSQVEMKMQASAASIAASMEASGKSTAGLMEAVAKAETAAAKVDELSAKTDAAANALSSAQAATEQSADALELLQQSAVASAENLQAAKTELDALKESGTATADELRAAEESVAEFSAETEELNQKIANATATHETNTAAVEKAQLSYRKLSAQMLSAQAAAQKTSEKFDALTDTFNAGGASSISGVSNMLTTLGSSTLTSASRSLGSMAASAMGLSRSTATGTLAADGLSSVLRMMIKTLGSAKLSLLGMGVAAVTTYANLYKARKEAESGVTTWQNVYDSIDKERTTDITTIINANLELQTEGLSEKVDSVYQEIADALTDGEPDTTAVITSVQTKSQELFTNVRERIQTWYDAEMSKLDLSTSAGLQKAEELSGEYNTMMDRVDALDASTGEFITSFAGKSTEECKAALTQLQGYEDELERLAGRADTLAALLKSDQAAAYTAVTAGVATDDTSIGNAVQYVKTSYELKLDNATEDYESQKTKLWNDFQTAYQAAQSEEEKLEIEAQYKPKLTKADEDYAAVQTQLTLEYKNMLAEVFQGLAKSLSDTDPGLSDALGKLLNGEIVNLSDLQIDNPTLANAMKAFVEAGVLDGITNADLSTADGQLQAAADLLARNTGAAVSNAFNGSDAMTFKDNKSFFGGIVDVLGGAVEVADRAGYLSETAEKVKGAVDLMQDSMHASIGETGLRSALDDFEESLNFNENGASGVQRMATWMDALTSSAANLDPSALQEYGSMMDNLMSIMDQMDPSGNKNDFAFLTNLSDSMNALGYSTDAGNVVDTLHELWDAYSQFGNEPMNMEPEVELTLPDPSELVEEGYLDGDFLTDEPVNIEPEVELTLPDPSELVDMGYLDGAILTDKTVTIEPEAELTLPDPSELVDMGYLDAAMLAAGESSGSNYTGGLIGALESASGAASGAAGSAASAAGSYSSSFGSAGDNSGAAYVSGVRKHISAARAAGAALGQATYSGLRSYMQINSPSKKMLQLGGYTGEGYALGIEDKINNARSSMKRLADAVIGAASRTDARQYNNSVNITLSNANIRNSNDLRQLSRELGTYIQGANFGY